MRLRLRLSLFARMGFSLAILLSITLVVAALLAAVGGMLGLALLGWVYRVVQALASLPRASAVAPVPPAVVAAAAFAGVLAVVRGWPRVRARTAETYLVPPTTPLSFAVTAGLLGCLYLFLVEGGAATLTALSTAGGVVSVLTLGVVLAVGGTVAEVRRRIRGLRADLLEDSAPVERAHPEVATAVRRLAQLVDVPEPTVRVTDTDRPESITVGAGEAAVVLVSSGLLEVLPDEELEAVLAHEVSHLANGDGRVMSAALAPVLAADEWIEDEPDGPEDRFWNGLFVLLKRYGQFGVAVLSRGREWSADAAAAELTGSPAALAAALRRLEEERGSPTPDADLREWERSVAVMDVLPPAEAGVSTGPFRTHPPTEARVEHLKRMAETAESTE